MKFKKPKLTNTGVFLLGCAYVIISIVIWKQFINQSVDYFTPLMAKTVVIEQVEVEVEKELEGVAWIAQAFEDAGLNPYEAFAVIWSESRGNDNAFNINTNNTIDLGIIQINSVHIKSGSISLECASTPECAVKWAIDKRLHDGNYSAWYGARALGIN